MAAPQATDAAAAAEAARHAQHAQHAAQQELAQDATVWATQHGLVRSRVGYRAGRGH